MVLPQLNVCVCVRVIKFVRSEREYKLNIFHACHSFHVIVLLLTVV